MIIKTRKAYKLKPKINYLPRILIASFVMGGFLFIYNYFVDMNLFLGILEIIIAAGIYFGMLFLLKELTKEDIEVVKLIIK